MKKRPLLILCLLLSLLLLLKGNALWQHASVAFAQLKACLAPAAPQTLKADSRFLIRDGMGGLTSERSTHLDAASYPDSFDFMPTVPCTLNGHEYLLWDEQVLKGFTDKFLVVENQGDMPVYFRTCIALPVCDMQRYVVFNRNTADYRWTDHVPVTIDGREYMMYLAEYRQALPPGQCAPASLLQMALQKDAPRDQVITFDIRVTTQLVGAEGFEGLSANQVLEQTMPVTDTFNPF